jgi:DNA-binding transcriptional regulator YhcF (GntR family)
MSNSGWIKLHRYLLDKAAWKICTEGQKVVLITILLLVNKEPKNWLWKGKLYECQAGQLITSISGLATASGTSAQTVRSAITKLEKAGFLTNESSPEGRLITVTNWDDYQGTANKAPTNRSTINSTSDQQTTQQSSNKAANKPRES